MKITKSAFSIFLITMILGISLTIGFIYSGHHWMQNNIRVKNEQEISLKTAYYNNSANPIYINGNAGGVGAHNWTWAENQPWCSGSGSWKDPYIIANISIDGQNLDSCIRIESSDVFFRIENSTFYNSSSGYFPSYKAGIELKGVKNGIIHNSTFSNNNGFGISLWNCENNTIINNTMIEDDIWTQGADHNYILENEFFSVGESIEISYGSSYNIIARNAFYDCHSGIYLVDDNNEIVNNTFSNCETSTILGYTANNNTILNNTILNCGPGISFQSGSNNTIMYNKIKNGYQGYNIRLFKSSNFNNVSYNIIINNSADGILVRNSQNNTLYNNTIKHNSNYGINLDECNYTTVRSNVLIKNLDGCINEKDCVGSVFENNICVEAPSEGNGEDPLISGYNIYIILTLISMASLILVIRNGKAHIDDKIK